MSQFSKCVSITLMATSLACLAAPLPALAEDVNDGLVATSPADSADVMIFKNRKLPANPKIGLALGGGGARGAAHVGALRMLEKEGIKFDYIVGTSIGSVVGGLYAAGATVDEIDKAFQSGKVMSSFMTVPLTVRIAVAPIMFAPRLFGKKSYDGLYKGNKFRKFLEQGIVSCPEMQIEKLKTPYAAVALNLLDGKPYMIRKGNLGYAMQASCAVPGLRKPVEMGDKLLVDGGVVCNVPVKQCREMGADIVIAVNIDQPFTPAERQSFLKVGSVAQRMLTWDLYAMDKFQAQIADVCIHPNTDKISLISRKKSDAKKGYDAGVIAATDAIPSIRKALEGISMVSSSRKIEAAEVVQ